MQAYVGILHMLSSKIEKSCIDHIEKKKAESEKAQNEKEEEEKEQIARESVQELWHL